MDVEWPEMVALRPGEIHRSGERLYWPEYHFSIVVPRTCSMEAGPIGLSIGSEQPGLWGIGDLHHGSDHLMSLDRWLGESFEDHEEQLAPAGSAEDKLGAVSRRLSSPSRAGFKVRVDDVFGNGMSGRFAGPVERADELSALVKQAVDSVRFVHLDSLAEDEVREAILGFLNVNVKTRGDLFLYLDRHFYVMRNDVMDTVETLAKQAAKESHPGAESIATRWEVLRDARQLTHDGDWDETIAELRSA